MTNYWYKLQTVWQTEGVKGVISALGASFYPLLTLPNAQRQLLLLSLL